MTNPVPPTVEWTQCSRTTESSDTASRCRGEAVEPYLECLSHLSDHDRARHLNSIHERREVRYRGTTIDSDLFRHVTAVLGDGHTRAYFWFCRFTGEVLRPTETFRSYVSFADAEFEGTAYFDGVTFLQDVEFTAARFKDSAVFEGAKFQSATFDGVEFQEWATFENATFTEDAFFNQAHFDKAAFDDAQFLDGAFFEGAEFSGEVSFLRTKFQIAGMFQGAAFDDTVRFSESKFPKAADFRDATFKGDAIFDSAQFKETSTFGPIRCTGLLDLTRVRFDHPVLLQLDAGNLQLRQAVFSAHASAQVTRAKIDMTHAVLNQPVDIIGTPLELDFATAAIRPIASLTSLRGVDCAMLTVSSISLANCTFSGALHLDQLRLEGAWNFRQSPRGWCNVPPFHHTRRQVIEEERRRRSNSGRMSSIRLWGSAPIDRSTPRYDTLAIIYRQLRKSREDTKDEPGAADFYYGEMEMRRLSRKWSTSERWLLQLYWLLSGYGLRASRALGWLALAMLTTVILMMGFGLPQDSPKQNAVGTVPPSGGKATFEIDKEDPQNPTGKRFTSERFGKSLKVTLNSVVFRSSGQDLTNTGDYIEMVSRFSEPVLLGLAALAIRGRVKR